MTKTAQTYSIGEVSKKLGISEHTLRYYEKDGLISKVGRLPNGHRAYDELAIGWIQVVQCLRKTGMSTENIKEYNALTLQGESTIPKRLELALRQKELIKTQIKEYEGILAVIDMKLKHFDSYMNQGT